MGEENAAALAFLRPSTIERLSVQLNTEKLLLTDTGLLRDWRGLYECTGINDRHIFDQIKTASDPFKQLLDHWKHRDNATVGNFYHILGELDRWDVVDDNRQRIAEDIKYADTLLKQKGFSVTMIENEIAGSEKILTYDDIALLKRGQKLARYDVLILHAAEEAGFAERVSNTLERQNIAVCLKDRDLVVGTMELQAMSKLISERCNKVAVILSPDFFSSVENSFYSTLAQSGAIQSNKRSFLPISYKPVKLPTNIDALTKLRVHNNPYFWTKLCSNIKEDWVEDRTRNPLPPMVQEVGYSSASPTALTPDKPVLQPTPAALTPSLPPTSSPHLPPACGPSLSTASRGKVSHKSGFINRMLTPVKNLVIKKSQSSQDFSSVVCEEAGGGEVRLLRQLNTAPPVPTEEPCRSPANKSIFKGLGKKRAESYQPLA